MRNSFGSNNLSASPITQPMKKHITLLAAGVANDGYWGIPVLSKTKYRASLLARAEPGFSGPVTVEIVSDDGKTVYASEQFSGLTANWNRFDLSFKTGKVVPTSKARFTIT